MFTLQHSLSRSHLLQDMLSRGTNSLLSRTHPSAKPPGFLAPPRHPAPQTFRTLSRRAAGPDKSWSEILSQATDLAKDVATKVKDTVVGAIAPAQAPPKPPPLQQRREDPGVLLERPGIFGSLLGRAVGGLVASAVNQIGKQMEQAAQESQSVYDDAAARIKASARLRSVMGEVQVGPIISQSVSSMSINGVSSKRVNLVFQVVGSSGQVAQAQVTSQEPKSSSITVQLPNGSVVKIDDKGKGWGAAETIDVEFREVRK